MFNSVRYLISDIAYWVRGHSGQPLRFVAGVAVLAAAAFGVYSLFDSDSDESTSPPPAPIAVTRTETKVVQPADLGFPSFATRNTTRVGGADPAANAAAVALATFPAAGTGKGPAAVSIVDSDDWASAIAASSLVAEPERIPILFSEGDGIPQITQSALETLAPAGSPATKQAQILSIGDAPVPGGLEPKAIGGGDEFETAAAIARERAKLTGEDPDHLVVAGIDDPAFAMPAAAWAARSGEPVLFTERDSVPAATRKAIEQFKNVTVYVLGPESAVSKEAFDELGKIAIDVRRIDENDPAANAVAFARYTDGDFGWNINDPGHGFVIANSDRPADAAAASGLSGSGTWGPLLVSDDAKELPQALRGYLLDLKPGYTDDPTRALYNHIWIIGDESALSVSLQADVDELAEVAKISSGPPPGGGSGDEAAGSDKTDEADKPGKTDEQTK